MVEELMSYKLKTCEGDIDPLPDDPACYRKNGRAIPEVTRAEALRLACEARKLVSDVDCKNMQSLKPIEWVFDPCKGPLVMCAPEQFSLGTTPNPEAELDGNHSIPIPSTVITVDPKAWIRPPAPRGGGGTPTIP